MGMAAENNDLLKVQKLIRRGVSVNCKNAASGVTALGVAAERGHMDMIKLLLSAKADVNEPTYEGLTPLHISAQFGLTDVVSLLIDSRSLVNTTCAGTVPSGTTPLIAATARNSLPTVQVLLAAQADVNLMAESAKGNALHIACELGHVEALRLLINDGAPDVLLRNKYGEMPIETAIVQGAARKFHDCAHLLRPLTASRGAMALADKDDRYIIAAMDSLAATSGALCEAEKASGGPAAEIPVAVELMYAHLRVAAIHGDMRSIKEMADPSVVNVGDHLGRTPLHHACSKGNLGIAAALLGRNADVHHVDLHGSTALHYAAQHDHLLVVKLLLKHDAEPDVTNDAGLTPLDMARSASATSVKILEEHVPEEARVVAGVVAGVEALEVD